MKLSIIIPVLNEAQGIVRTLESLQAMRDRGVELIVVDGGSKDNTMPLSQPCADLIIRSEPGRARQMNTGASRANGEILLFLHADTTLPSQADLIITDALSASGKTLQQTIIAWGRFDVCIAGRHWMLKVVASMMNWRSRLTHICTGDQAIFMTRPAFDKVGGFPEQPLMEDIEISTRLRRLARPVSLSHTVVTSGRRWDTRGVWRTIFLMWELRWRYWRGDAPNDLARRYR